MNKDTAPRSLASDGKTTQDKSDMSASNVGSFKQNNVDLKPSIQASYPNVSQSVQIPSLTPEDGVELSQILKAQDPMFESLRLSMSKNKD